METERAKESVEFFAYARRFCAETGGFSPIFITAALSGIILLTVFVLKVTGSLDARPLSPLLAGEAQDAQGQTNTGTIGLPVNASSEGTAQTTSSDPLSDLGTNVLNQLTDAYVQMQQTGIYSTTTATVAGQSLAPYVRADISYPNFSADSLKTDTDISYARMLQYRSDLRTAFAPLLQNTEPEYEIFARYVETKDASYLTTLQAVAKNYRDAAALTSRVVVPADAVSYHVAILNAMEEFGATLDAMSAHANDPFASVALLRSYDEAESDMLNSFNALTTYYKSKQP